MSVCVFMKFILQLCEQELRLQFHHFSKKLCFHFILLEALSTGKAGGTPGLCHHSQSPPHVSVHSRETCLPAIPRLSSPGSTHTMVARGTAIWEILVG